jgi:hypothetical protein
MSTLVFGHRNPDTDAICSAIAYADLLQQTTRPDAVAACCGPPNKRTEYVLTRAGLPPPRIVMDVRPSAEDLCRREIVTASFGDSFHDAYQRMQAADLRAIPVVDSQRKVVGVLSVLHLMDLFFNDEGDPLKLRTVTTCLQKIHDVLGGSFQHVLNPQQRDELLVMVGAMSAEGFTDRMHKFPAERLIVVCGDRPTIQLPAIEHGVRLLVITGGFSLSAGLAELAKIRDVSVKTNQGAKGLAEPPLLPSPDDTWLERQRFIFARAWQEMPPLAALRGFLYLSARVAQLCNRMTHSPRTSHLSWQTSPMNCLTPMISKALAVTTLPLPVSVLPRVTARTSLPWS